MRLHWASPSCALESSGLRTKDQATLDLAAHQGSRRPQEREALEENVPTPKERDAALSVEGVHKGK